MENWKAAMVQYFADGAKHTDQKQLGVEMEHFIVDGATGQAVPYAGENGVKQILTRLMAQYPDAVILPEDDFLGFQVPEFSITLEPAAQMEISIAPISSIHCIGNVYRDFYSRLNAILTKSGYEAKTVGCQPVSRVEELALIPKRRYALMNQYFQSSGTGGMEMMRGTASMQISIDYASEEDFRRKIQAAYYYGPLLKLLMDHSAAFQGNNLKTHLKRTEIWRRTDPVRCGILPGIFSDHYGFEDYADFIGQMPPIFLKHGKDVEPTGQQTVADLFRNRTMNEELLAHVLSMAFPDVRLKQYVEIRFADSVPFPFLLAYCALIKGLLYSEAGLGYAREKIRGDMLQEQDILRAEDEMIKYGWNADVYGDSSGNQAGRLLAMAREELPEEERSLLVPLEAVIRCGGICGIPAEELQDIWKQYA